MLSLSPDAMDAILSLSKTPTPPQMFRYDCITLFIDKSVNTSSMKNGDLDIDSCAVPKRFITFLDFNRLLLQKS